MSSPEEFQVVVESRPVWVQRRDQDCPGFELLEGDECRVVSGGGIFSLGSYDQSGVAFAPR